MAAIPEPARFPYGSQSMIRSLEEVAFHVNTNDIPSARIKLGQIKGISPTVAAQIQKRLFAFSPVYVYQMKELIDTHDQNEAQFLRTLSPRLIGDKWCRIGDKWYMLNPMTCDFTARIQDLAGALVSSTLTKHSFRQFLNDYYSAYYEFSKSSRTDKLIQVVYKFSQEITELYSERGRQLQERSTYDKIGPHHKLDTQELIEDLPHDVDVFLNTSKLNQELDDYSTFLKNPKQVRLNLSFWELNCEPDIQTLSFASYGRLRPLRKYGFEPFFFATYTKVWELLANFETLFLKRPTYEPLTLEEVQQMKPSFFSTLRRKNNQLHSNIYELIMAFGVEYWNAQDRMNNVSETFLDSPIFDNLCRDCVLDRKSEQFLEKTALWIEGLPKFVRDFLQVINAQATHLSVQFQTLLNLHQVLASCNMVALQKEKKSFNVFLLTLSDRIKHVSPTELGKYESAIRSQPKMRAYRNYLQRGLQLLNEIQSALGGVVALQMTDMDRLEHFRSPTFLKVKWAKVKCSEIEPLTRYRTIKWLDGSVEDVSYIAKICGVPPPHKFLQFDCFAPMHTSDLPVLRALRQIGSEATNRNLDAGIARLESMDESPGAAVTLLTPPAVDSKRRAKRPKEEGKSDRKNEAETKYAAAASATEDPSPALTTPHPLSRLKTMVLESIEEGVKAATAAEIVGVEEAMKQAKGHLNNVFALTNRLEQQLPYTTSIRPQIFHTFVSIVEAANLAIEQVLQAIHSKNHPVEDKSKLMLTHSLNRLIKENPEVTHMLTADEYRMLMDMNFVGFDTRDIALFSQPGKEGVKTSSRIFLTAVYRWKSSEEPIEHLLRDLHSRITLSLAVFAKLTHYFLETTWEGAKQLNEWSKQWEEALCACAKESRKMLPAPFTTQQQRANEHIEAIRKLIHGFRTPELELDNDILFENLLDNKLLRLEMEIAKQARLDPEEIPGHVATIFSLTNLIAMDLLYIYAIYLEDLGVRDSAPIPEKLAELAAGLYPDKLPDPLRDFVSAPIRTIVRYSESFDREDAHAKTAKTVGQMQRAFSLAAAAPAAPTHDDLSEGFTMVDPRNLRKLKDDVLGNIRQLSELLHLVCVLISK